MPIREFLNRNNGVSEAMGYIEEKTRIPRLLQFYILIILTCLWLTFGYGAPLLANLIAFIYPAYESIRAIESEDEEDDKKWLIYWTVFGFFACFDMLVVNFLGGLTFYYLLKSIFLIWCYLPIEHNGSHILYKQVILGLFIRYHGDIDATMRAAGRQILFLIEFLAEKGEVVAIAGKEATARMTEASKATMARMAEVGKEATAKMTEVGKATATRVAEAGQEAMSKMVDKGREVAEKVKEKRMQYISSGIADQ